MSCCVLCRAVSKPADILDMSEDYAPLVEADAKVNFHPLRAGTFTMAAFTGNKVLGTSTTHLFDLPLELISDILLR